jgi:prepilin-type N-terminal cleavage/methylation domain-containing protein
MTINWKTRMRLGEETPTSAAGFFPLRALALSFEVVNGFHATANAVAKVVSTYRLKPVSVFSRQRKAGFTLVEILVVLATMAILAALAVPAFTSISAAKGTTQASYQVSQLLELAHDQAVANQTYVWVGFANTTVSGTPTMVMGAVSSLDGTGSNTAANNLNPLSKPILVQNVNLVPFASLSAGTKALVTGTPDSVANNQNGISMTAGEFTLTTTLTFTPRGEALLNGQALLGGNVSSLYVGYDPLIDVSMSRCRGGTPIPSVEDIAVILDGATGVARIVRQ